MPAQSSSQSKAASTSTSSNGIKPSPQRWSVAVQKNLKRAATSPKVASFIDQAQTRAQQLINDGKLDQAQALLKTYVNQLPRDPAIKNEFAKVTVQRAQQLLSDQNIDAAAKMAREALAVQPTNQAAHNVLATALNKQGLSVGNAADRVKAAKSLYARGRIVDAEMEYNSAVKIKPSADAYIGLGDIAYKQGNKEKAKDNYQKALELEPHSGSALRQMGIIRLGQNDTVGANSDLSRALVVDPNDSVASKHLVELWQQQVTQNPQSANSHLGLARAHQLSGDLKSAQTEYRKVVEIDPNNVNLPAARQSFKLALARQDAHHAIDAAHNLEAAGALQEAHAKVSEAVKLCPGDSSFKLYQAQLGEKLGLNASSASSGSGAAAAAAVGGMSAAAAGLLPGLAPPVAPSYKNSAPQAQMASAPEQPPAMALDGIPKPAALDSMSQVSSMSGFLTSLRNYSVQQKQQSQDLEDAQHSGLKSIGQGGQVPSSLLSSSPDPTAASTNSAIAGADASLASVNKLLKSIGAPSSSSGSSHAEQLGSTAAAAASALGSAVPKSQSASSYTPSSYSSPSSVTNSYAAPSTNNFARSLTTESSSFDNTSAPISTSSYSPSSTYKSSKPVAKPSTTSATASAKTTAAKTAAAKSTAAKPKTATQPNLAEQNKQLQAQLQAAQAQLKALKTQPSTSGLQAETPKTAEPLSATPSSFSPTSNSAASSFANPASSTFASPTASTAVSSFPSITSTAGQAVSAAAPEIATYSALPSQASAATAAALSVAPNAANASVQSILQSLPPSLTSSEGFKNALANLPNSSSALQSYAANLPPETQSALQAALKPPIATASHVGTPGAVRLELEGVKPSPMDIKLNVVLHNDQRTALNIPASAKAIINMKGEPQRVVKVAFASKTVPPNGELHGVIKVPGHNLSPTADLYIPDLLPGQGMDRDVHLTVPISFK